ncbi:MAG: HAD family hydrolase [Planctomycetota bacterium]|nr:HAD family hydrolase [Planctomycetota bacterium]
MDNRSQTIRAVIFDLDDTLFPERDYVCSGYAAVGEYLREALGSEERFEAWLWDRFLAGQSSGAFDALNRQFKLGLSEERIGRLIATYRQHRPKICPYPDVRQILARLKKRCRLGLLSDGFLPAQRLKLESLQLERFFDAVVFTEELGREFWKPSPAGFEKICQLIDVKGEACAYVADNVSKDFIAPNRLGWRTIRYLRPGQIHAEKAAPAEGEPQLTVHTPKSLMDALDCPGPD